MADVIPKQNVIDQLNALTVDGELSQADVNHLINYLIANGDQTGTPRDLIQIRRGNFANLPSLAQGELAVTLDEEKLYVGGLNGNIDLLAKAGGAYKSVKSFKAKGDGITNDTQAFKNAFADLQDGDTLYVPNGVYIISVNQLALEKDNVRIIGTGTLKCTTENGGYLFRIMASNVVVDGLTFDGGYPLAQINENSLPITGVNIETPDNGSVISNITIQNCTMQNMTCYGIGVTENSFNLATKNQINKVRILNNKVYAAIIPVEVFPKVISDDIIVMGNHVEVIGTTSSAETDAIKPCQMYKNAVVTNNILIGGKTACVSIGGVYSENMVFADNIVVTTLGSGVGLNLMPHVNLPGAIPMNKNLKIENNIIVAQRYGLLINGRYDYERLIIDNNIVVGIEGSMLMSNVDGAVGGLKGIRLYDNDFRGVFKIRRSDDGTKRVQNVVIKGGSIFPQIDAQYVDDITLEGVLFENSTTFPISFNGCTGVRVIDVKVNRTTDVGAAIANSTDVIVKGCEFKNVNVNNTAGVNCLNIVGAGNNVIVEGNQFINETGIGYAIRAVFVAGAYDDVYVMLNNIYRGMISADCVNFEGLVYAGMQKSRKLLYANQSPATQFAGKTFALFDEAINMIPQEVGASPNKYIVEGWLCTSAGTAGTWVEKRVLTGN